MLKSKRKFRSATQIRKILNELKESGLSRKRLSNRIYRS